MKLLLPAFILLQMLCCVRGYPSGSPMVACDDMMPRHPGVLPQPSPAPYVLLTNTRVFQPGEAVTVTIAGPEYRGVLLEARTDGRSNALGRWRIPPPDTRFLQCAGNPNGAVTHSNTNLKGNTTVYSWIPLNSTSPVFFMATVAQQSTVFWVNVKSTALTRGKPGDLSLATGAGMAEENSLLLISMCFLVLQMLW